MRLIDADALIAEIEKRRKAAKTLTGIDMVMLLKDAPTIEPRKAKRESRAMLPCKCGCKRREHWFSPGSEMPEELRCYQCGFTVYGKNQIDVIRQWNKEVSGNEAD